MQQLYSIISLIIHPFLYFALKIRALKKKEHQQRFNKNTFHQCAPLDTSIIVSRFLKHWEPKLSIFVESELWPNMIFQSSKNSKLILLNCRISKRSEERRVGKEC